MSRGQLLNASNIQSHCQTTEYIVYLALRFIRSNEMHAKMHKHSQSILVRKKRKKKMETKCLNGRIKRKKTHQYKYDLSFLIGNF